MNRVSQLRRFLLIFAVLVSFWSAGAVQAMFMRPEEVPVERLIANTAAFVKEHPDDPRGYYTLARIHNLAFTLKNVCEKLSDSR